MEEWQTNILAILAPKATPADYDTNVVQPALLEIVNFMTAQGITTTATTVAGRPGIHLKKGAKEADWTMDFGGQPTRDEIVNDFSAFVVRKVRKKRSL